MNRKNMILGLSIIIILLIPIVIFFLSDCNNDETDAYKFKKEYEELNGTIREVDGSKYNDVTIPEDNPIEYISVNKALNILESDKAIIYIGANWCPWCRASVPVMFDVAKKLNISKIYYLTLDDAKSNFEVVNGKVKKINNGSSDYYKLLDKLDSYLTDYYVKDEDGNSYETGEKRIYMPFFITVKNGSIVEAKEVSRTISEGETKYSDITDEQYNELYGKFKDMFEKLYSTGVCTQEEKCN